MNVVKDKRFEGIRPFEKKVWLSTPTMHGEELQFVQAAIDANWVFYGGGNINISEKRNCRKDWPEICGRPCLWYFCPPFSCEIVWRETLWPA